MQITQIFLVNVDSENKLFKVFTNFCPFQRGPPNKFPPQKQIFNLRIFDGSLPFVAVLRRLSNHLSIPHLRISVPQSKEQRKGEAFAKRDNFRPQTIPRKKNRMRNRIPLLSHHPSNSDAQELHPHHINRNKPSGRLVCLYYQYILVFTNTRITTDF